jgi:hypothetical protein
MKTKRKNYWKGNKSITEIKKQVKMDRTGLLNIIILNSQLKMTKVIFFI